MRIRRRTSHILGSAYSTPATPPPMLVTPPPISEPCSEPLISHIHGDFLSPTTTPSLCKLSRSPWDLLDDLSLSDPQVSISLSYFIFLLYLSNQYFILGGSVCEVHFFSKRITFEKS
jgi:hypothetical protein